MDTLLNNPFFQSSGFLLASALLAVAVGALCWQMLDLATAPREQLGDSHPFERQRRGALRDRNVVYRRCEPLVDELAGFFGRLSADWLETLQLNLTRSREKLPWRADEFMAVKCLEGAAIGALLMAMLWLLGWPKTAVVLGIAVPVVYVMLTPKTINDRANKRLSRIRIRLPFVVDLIALTMKAGGGFQECLQTAANENGDHPLTEELVEVVRQIALGRPRHESLSALQERLQDDDIGELIFAINKGEELGTSLSSILSDQAEQMRLKRSQYGEKAAAEAAVAILFPGMFAMIACLLAVVGPIALPIVLTLL